jgi:hypothetical protein
VAGPHARADVVETIRDVNPKHSIGVPLAGQRRPQIHRCLQMQRRGHEAGMSREK